jgi:DNA-binding cell septation regulator SpoVG
MRITSVDVLLRKDSGNVRAYANLNFDREFVVSNFKVVDGHNGLLVIVPTEPVLKRCPRCTKNNRVHARYCNWCKQKLLISEEEVTMMPRRELYRDVAYPTNIRMRNYIKSVVLQAFDYCLKKGWDRAHCVFRKSEIVSASRDYVTNRKL